MLFDYHKENNTRIIMQYNSCNQLIMLLTIFVLIQMKMFTYTISQKLEHVCQKCGGCHPLPSPWDLFPP